MLDSGNDIVNALLRQKLIYAGSKNIQLDIQSSLPESLPIDSVDLCTVISNLLDNAIDACVVQDFPKISLSIQQAESYIHIQCVNTVTFDVCKENPGLRTTKQSGYHGIGLQIVRRIVEKYDGIFEYHMEDMSFFVTLMLHI